MDVVSGLVKYFCDVHDVNNKSRLRHETTVSRPCMQCLVSSEEAGSIEHSTRRDMQGPLNPEGKYGYVINDYCGIGKTY